MDLGGWVSELFSMKSSWSTDGYGSSAILTVYFPSLVIAFLFLGEREMRNEARESFFYVLFIYF